VARAVSARSSGVSGVSGVTVLECRQLVPELAESIARAGRVVFVDARQGGQLGGGVTTLELHSIAAAPLTHVVDPRALLALAARLHGRRPPAWIVTVPAFDTGIGEGLSPGTAALVDRAVDAVFELLAGA